jgi:perosamine synthetase
MRVPLSSPDIGPAEMEAVTAVLQTSQLSLGPKLREFESLVATYVGLPYAIGVSSGTAGLHLALLALGLGEGDEVIVPSFTFIAVANAVRYVRATPVFVDVDPETLNADPAHIEAAITLKTRAIIVVHTFGYPAEMTPILALARRHNLRIIEDACEALGSTYNGQPAGCFGDIGVFAFYPNKQITTGEGGMIVTREPALAREMRALRNHGRYDTDDWLQHSILGYNYRLSEINCALGCAQMARLPEILQKREAVAISYAKLFSDTDLVQPPPSPPAHLHMSWFVYVVRIAEHAPISRDAVLARMAEQGVQCGRYFAPVHLQPAYAGLDPRPDLPITEAVSRRTLALPFFTGMLSGQIEYVAETLLRILQTAA